MITRSKNCVFNYIFKVEVLISAKETCELRYVNENKELTLVSSLASFEIGKEMQQVKHFRFLHAFNSTF